MRAQKNPRRVKHGGAGWGGNAQDEPQVLAMRGLQAGQNRQRQSIDGGVVGYEIGRSGFPGETGQLRHVSWITSGMEPAVKRAAYHTARCRGMSQKLKGVGCSPWQVEIDRTIYG